MLMPPISKALPRIMAKILVPHQGSVVCSGSGRAMTRRFFFASSTDHTTLLAQAEIHVLPVANTPATVNDGNTPTTTTQQIVLAPCGMDGETVRKVPQLHMARLLLTTTSSTTSESNEIVMTLHSAKVVNRSLGSTVHVCRRLLEYAMAQQGKMTNRSSRNVKIFAKSTLHGLSEWTLTHLFKTNSETTPET
jgi:hypothetical protein